MQNLEEGTVMVDVTIDAHGKILDVAVDPDGTFAAKDLQAAAVAGVAQWKFHPGIDGAQTVGGTMQVPIHFGIAFPCSEGFTAQGRAVSGYVCLATPSVAVGTKGKCLNGFARKQLHGLSYACILDDQAFPSPPTSG